MAEGLYRYKPNATLAIVCAGLFGISAIIHLIVMIKRKAWFFTAFVIGAIMMTLGYIARFASARKDTSVMLYAIQSLLIILPPSLYAATMYMIFGRLVVFVNHPSASLIRPTRVTKIFVTGDTLSFLLQAGGGGMMSISSMANMGQTLIMVGLACQLLFFGFFLVMAITFRQRMLKSFIPKTGKYNWHSLMTILLIASGLIIARCVFRMVEFGLGRDGALMAKEAYVYIGDTLLMFLVQIMFHFRHASRVFAEPVGNVGGMKVFSTSNVELGHVHPQGPRMLHKHDSYEPLTGPR
ncbi:hypothetical protein GLAREA_03303 [Glarea lozoyensis ATCC 20868]|uniref:RTA1 like protein n=1 Tax=Glarea lozoyensis (strain ATCC 20868 / MF5171) TaxID=1116229 RepID=S3DLG1_GLAL2|nr:uncharacterized protein GLAREA_03303 [Glarea lozoyensis ATCC 20868]EPE27388.1 hypothetical protein GLAREA_03303 [Glarea lozoyensis ATCC 20868]